LHLLNVGSRPTINDFLQQHAGLMPLVPQAKRPGRLFHRTAPQRYVLPLLGALVCLLLTVGTSQAAYWYNLGYRSFTRLCPTHVAGDREFAGHGPDVYANAFVYTTGHSDEQLAVSFYLRERETRSDWSEASKSWAYLLYTAPSGQSIWYIYNTQFSEVTYTDTDHYLDWFYPADNLVSAFVIMGDTSGNDIGNCTADDAYLSVYFEPIWVWIDTSPR
jgi:hypothetical protein